MKKVDHVFQKQQGFYCLSVQLQYLYMLNKLDYFRCNGTAECKYGEDERDCKNCQLDEFRCNSGQCIQQKWVCDTTRDCNDGSDETTESCSKGINN